MKNNSERSMARAISRGIFWGLLQAICILVLVIMGMVIPTWQFFNLMGDIFDVFSILFSIFFIYLIFRINSYEN